MTPSLTPQEFVEKWRNTTLGERQSYQAHFMDVCRLVGYETPSGSGSDQRGNEYVFEKSLKKQEGGQGYADVYLQRHFAIEYKAPGKHKTLDDAYNQLLQYREKLENPVLLIVTDIQNWEIHTNFPNSEKRVYKFTHEEIGTRSVVQDWLRYIFHQPERLHPQRNKEQVTRDAANAFQLIADNMRAWQAEPERIANFLTRLVFCLFAEDVGLLPAGIKGDTGVFSEIIENNRMSPDRFLDSMAYLFKAMADGGRIPFVNIDIPYFNGSLFNEVQVEKLELEALLKLEQAARLNWESVEPAIFGTLFERSLDPAKRSQLGAHYTSRDDIELIVKPVLMQPLEREWQRMRDEATVIRLKYDEALTTGNRRNQTTYANQLSALRDTMLERVASIRVLDPACGSGNFLYVALQSLLGLEKTIITDEVFSGLTRPLPRVHPHQMYGIEINPIAHVLASIVVWIGYIQWRKQNGYVSWSEPILEDLHENIVCKDAILAFDADGQPQEAVWPDAEIIIGNPPFLGARKLQSEFEKTYLRNIYTLYGSRITDVDLVIYWFEKARKHIEAGKAKRAGLLATNSIRGGANREVLKRIKETGDIFMAWADREWMLEGAAVRVSMVGFDNGDELQRTLDGRSVQAIHSDLTSDIDLAVAVQLTENRGICFQGTSKTGPFDIPYSLAKQMINQEPENRKVLRPWMNAMDLTRSPRNMWVVDFDSKSLEEAQTYKLPYEYILKHVKPQRDKTAQKQRREAWWQHGVNATKMRLALSELKSRFLATPRVSKHRIYAWLNLDILPDTQLVVFARDDDYFFGVLHSTLHEVWSLRMGTWLGKGNDPRYTPTTTFETFPFPWSPGTEPVSDARYQAIAQAAKQLHEERDAWLNPPGMSAAQRKERTLTNLYNALNVFRGVESMRVKASAGDFAPRLDALHQALDAAVCAAYGWDQGILSDEDAMLRHLLALNLERA